MSNPRRIVPRTTKLITRPTTERFFLLNPDRKRNMQNTPKGALFIRRRSEEKTYRRGGSMELLALVMDPTGVVRYLRGIGEPTDVPKRTPTLLSAHVSLVTRRGSGARARECVRPVAPARCRRR